MYYYDTVYVFVIETREELVFIEGRVHSEINGMVRLDNVRMLTGNIEMDEVVSYCLGGSPPATSHMILPDGFILPKCISAFPVKNKNAVMRWGVVWFDIKHQVLSKQDYVTESAMRLGLSQLTKGTDVVIISPSGERWTETVS